MATTGQKGRKPPGKPYRGLLVGAILTYGVAYFEVGPPQLRPTLLTILTPLGWYLELFLVESWGAICSKYNRHKMLRGKQKAIAVAQAAMQNPDLPPAQREDYQNVMHQLKLEEIYQTGYSNPTAPTTKSNSKPDNEQ